LEALVLMLGYIASLGIVGVGGIYVGQRTVQQRLGMKERIFRLPVDPGPAGDPAAADEPDITFYEKLGQKGRAASEKKPEPDAVPAADAPGAQERAGEGRLILPGAPPPSGRPDEDPQARRASAQPPREGSAAPEASARHDAQPAAPGEAPATLGAAPRSDAVKPAPAGPEPSTEPTVVATPAEREPAQRVSPEAAATVRALLSQEGARPDAPSGPAGTWSVQVNATQNQAVAEELAQRLRTRGYDAYVVTQAREGAVWYRVRVGRLPSLEMANALVGQLKEREGLPHAFVASD
jgi:DedD protein